MTNLSLAAVTAAASPSLFAALFVIAMAGAGIAGAMWVLRNDRRR